MFFIFVYTIFVFIHENNIDVLDKSREDSILEKNIVHVAEEFQDYYKQYLDKVLELSKDFQRGIINE